MKLLPLWGRGVKNRSANISVQRRLNLYTEKAAGEDLDFALMGRPGLAFLTRNYLSVPGQPVDAGTAATGLLVYDYRTTVGSFTEYGSGYISSFSDGWLQGRAINQTSTPTVQEPPIGGTDAYPLGMVDMAFNGNVVVAVNGAAAWYASPSNYLSTPFDIATTYPAGTFPWTGATSICYIANRFVCNYPPNAGQFCWSELNSFIGGVWDGLDFSNAESSPDGLVAVRAVRGELVLFGKETIEFWNPDPQTVFSKIQGTTQPYGLLAQWSVQTSGDVTYFLGVQSGQPQIYAMKGYQVARISTPGVERMLIDDGIDLSAPTSSIFSIAGHTFYVLNLANTSLVWDVTENTWGEWQTDGKRWCGQFVAPAWGQLLVTDYRNSKCYTMDIDTFDDNGQPIIKEFVSQHTFANLDRFTLWELAVEFEGGVGLSSGQGSDPQAMLQISRDHGHTFGSEMWTTMGAIGQYLQRAVWRRLGRQRDLVTKIRVSDSVKTVAVRASVNITK
jgi:hypothetical protein